MKVHLIFAPPKHMPRMGELNEGLHPPLGLLYVAGYLNAKMPEVEIKVTDGLLREYPEVLADERDYQADIIGISFLSLCANSAYQLGRDLKRINRNCLLVMGGPHATALYGETLEESMADLVVVGEGEVTFAEIVHKYAEEPLKEDWSNVPGIAWKADGKTQCNVIRDYVQDLDSLPLPARKLVNFKDYAGWYFCKQTPETSMIFSRGCPYHCTFCSNKVWKMTKPYVRLRSPKSIADEIEFLVSEYGVREVFDQADELNNNMKHAIDVCEELSKRNMRVTWKTNVRAWPMTEELARAMADSGCWYVHLGIESSNQQTLDGIGKHILVQQVEEACHLMKKHGIFVFGMFMLHNVWEENGELKFEDVEMTRKTLAFARRLIDRGLIDYFSGAVTTPYPASKLYEIAVRHNLIRPELVGEWDRWYSSETFVMKLPGISRKEQARLKALATRLRIRGMLKSGHLGLKDIPLMMRKGKKAVLDQLRNLFT